MFRDNLSVPSSRVTLRCVRFQKREDLKIKLHGIVAVPDVLLGRDNLSPQVKDITVSLFEDSEQRKIFRPKKGEGMEGVRILKEKFYNFYRPGDIINVMKYKRWTRHVEYMASIRHAYTLLIRKSDEPKQYGEGWW
jgi:hypothetical protein